MEFEFHVTVNDLNRADKEAFVKLCQAKKLKPLMIVLDKGNYIQQPMFTGFIRSTSFHEANDKIEKIINKFQESGFSIKRKKVETSPNEEEYFHHPLVKKSTPYFEWHGKVEIDDVTVVKNLCSDLGGHISRNSLNANGRVRFITIREYDSKENFYKRVNQLLSILEENDIEILKEIYELCIYDSREELDSGWIS